VAGAPTTPPPSRVVAVMAQGWLLVAGGRCRRICCNTRQRAGVLVTRVCFRAVRHVATCCDVAVVHWGSWQGSGKGLPHELRARCQPQPAHMCDSAADIEAAGTRGQRAIPIGRPRPALHPPSPSRVLACLHFIAPAFPPHELRGRCRTSADCPGPGLIVHHLSTHTSHQIHDHKTRVVS
jgi:hypothetical protein